MNRSEIAVLRTKLRALNIEYSALVRGRTGEDTCVRMEELRVERRALMALIAQQRLEGRKHDTPVKGSAGALPLPLPGSEMTAVYSPSAAVGSAGPPIEAPPTT
jgi:hypothetical protein